MPDARAIVLKKLVERPLEHPQTTLKPRITAGTRTRIELYKTRAVHKARIATKRKPKP
jgi:hypothetical protein